jgi:hypothetical protein
MLQRADFHAGDSFVPRGSSKSSDVPVAVHLLPAIVAPFNAQNPGWRARVNALRMEVVERERTLKRR